MVAPKQYFCIVAKLEIYIYHRNITMEILYYNFIFGI